MSALTIGGDPLYGSSEHEDRFILAEALAGMEQPCDAEVFDDMDGAPRSDSLLFEFLFRSRSLRFDLPEFWEMID